MIAKGVYPNCIWKKHNQGYLDKKEFLKLDAGVRFYDHFTEQPQHFRKHQYALLFLSGSGTHSRKKVDRNCSMGQDPPMFLKGTALSKHFVTQVVFSWDAFPVQIYYLECSASWERASRLNSKNNSLSDFRRQLVNRDSYRGGPQLHFERAQPGLFRTKRNFEIGHRGQILRSVH